MEHPTRKSGQPGCPGVETMADAGPKLLRGLLEVFILESLEQSPKHGYALLKEMTDTFGAQPNRNRLYPLLARLVADGYVREVSEGGGNRTLYSLTDAGRDALHSYRRLPAAFRHALRRIWSVEVSEAVSAPEPARSVPVADAEDGEAEAPAFEPARPEGALPYPCPEARVTLEKEPASGDLTLRLRGCPMGSYDYCVRCPVAKGVEGLKRLVFSM